MNKTGYPEPIVGAFIMNHDNKIFLMKSYKWSNMWVVPGGHIELGETIENALKRETKEETNMDISHPQFICLLEFINGKEFHDTRHMLFLNYRVDAVSHDVILNSEGQEYGWFTKEEALALQLNSYTRKTLEEFPSKVFTPQ